MLFLQHVFSFVLVFVSMFSSFGFFVSIVDCFMVRSLCPIKEWIPASSGMENNPGPCIGACNVAPL